MKSLCTFRPYLTAAIVRLKHTAIQRLQVLVVRVPILRRLLPERWVELEALEPRVLLSGAPPTIVFDGTPYMIDEGDSAVLDASSSTDPEVDPLTYEWDLDNDAVFGDVTGANPTVDWATLNSYGIDDNGIHTIGLRLDDGTSQPTDTVTLTVSNTTPTIALSGDATVNEQSVYTLTLGAVTDPGDDAPFIYIVDWDDGGDPSAYFSTGAKTHTYANDGAYDIAVTISDEDGSHAGAGSKSITVNNVAPSITGGTTESLAAVNEDDTSPAGATVNSLFLSHFSDPADAFAGVAATANAANAVTEGNWQFSTDAGSTWSNIGTGVSNTSAVVLEPTDRIRFLPASDYNGGPGDLTLRVWDGSSGSAGTGQDISGSVGSAGAFSSDTVALDTTVNGVNDAPTFTSSPVTDATEDAAYTYGSSVKSVGSYRAWNDLHARP